MDPQWITSGLINSKYASLVSPEDAKVESITGANIGTIPTANPDDKALTNLKITIDWPTYPDESKLKVAPDTMDITMRNGNGDAISREVEGRRLFDYSWVYGPVRYKAEIKANDVVIESIVQDVNTYENTYALHPNDKIVVEVYYGYENKDINSDKITKEYTVPDDEVTITFPDATYIGQRSKLEEWASANNIAMTIRNQAASSTNEPGTFVIYDHATNNAYSLGQTIVIKKSEIGNLQVECVYYEKTYSITSDSTSVKQGGHAHFSTHDANDGEQVTWKFRDNVGADIADIAPDGTLTVHEDAPVGATIQIYAEFKTKKNAKFESNTITVTVAQKDIEPDH